METHHLDVGDVKATRCYISGNEHRHFSLAKVGESGCALSLGLVSMNRDAIVRTALSASTPRVLENTFQPSLMEGDGLVFASCDTENLQRLQLLLSPPVSSLPGSLLSRTHRFLFVEHEDDQPVDSTPGILFVVKLV